MVPAVLQKVVADYPELFGFQDGAKVWLDFNSHKRVFLCAGPSAGFQPGFRAAGARGVNYYGKVDNHGSDGANYVFSDGHGEFVSVSVNDTFFSCKGKFSITAMNPNRDKLIQTID